ncbi:MAG: helix-turn-helix transcriptional regulator [Kiritimatiellae bacterium]|nr:helix-turn-helix transcriptional regulator [Kiritimatiellia bacterium]
MKRSAASREKLGLLSDRFELISHPRALFDPRHRGMKTYKGYPALMKLHVVFPCGTYVLHIDRVSHRIYEGKTGGLGIARRGHTLHYCLAGEAPLVGGGKTLTYKPGRLFAFRARSHYYARCDEPVDIENLYIEFTIEEPGLAGKGIEDIEVIHKVDMPRLYVDLEGERRREFEKHVFAIVKIMYEHRPSCFFRAQEQVLALFSLCLEWDIVRIIHMTREHFGRNWHHRLWIEKARHFIRQRYADKIAVADIGRYAGVDPGYLNKLFRKETGKSLNAYLGEFRIQTAKSIMLAGQTSVTEIALASGFRDPSYFAASFRKATGESPSEYLKRL